MSKTLTIEVPDSVVQQLKVFAGSGDMPLSELIVNTLHVFAKVTESIQAEDPAAQAQIVQKLRETITQPNQSSTAGMLKSLEGNQNLAVEGEVKNPNSEIDEEYDVLLSLAGTLDLGTTDLGENHDRYIAETLERELIIDD